MNKLFFLFSTLLVSALACTSNTNKKPTKSLFFDVNFDKKLGKQVADEVERDPKNRVLSERDFPKAYAHLKRIRDKILASGQVHYRYQFDWQVKIIQDDQTLNAFCAPGGYIYVYTGLIKYLDSEDHFAGVLAHEIAHADRRHVIKALEKAVGVQVLIAMTSDPNSDMSQIVSTITQLGFSRQHETDADMRSVDYLCGTGYQGNATAGFFEKLLISGQAGGTPAFLSTHPSPKNRVLRIHQYADAKKCSIQASNGPYADFKRSLP